MEGHYIRNIDAIREREYPMLGSTTYLDHAGTTLYAKSLIDRFSEDMVQNLFGNPHSASASSELSTRRIDHVRSRVLEFFKADPEQYDVVFVANATAAVKMVMTAFQDQADKQTDDRPRGFWYGYHRDAHTSLVGVRQVATAGSKCFESDRAVDDWIHTGQSLPTGDSVSLSNNGLGLFAYPAQSNMNGHRLPLRWAGELRKSVRPAHRNIYTLLDAAAYVTTAQLDLSDAENAPDYVALSFYKIFGFPDLGALIVRKAAGHILTGRRYFGGGTVDMVIAMGQSWHAMKEHVIHEQLEDGTLPFHSIIALGSAIDVHEELYGSQKNVSAHTCYVAKVMYDWLSSLRHGNGSRVATIYNDPTSRYGDSKTQGPTIAFNLYNSQGGWIGKTDLERLAVANSIQLRTGGVCNPGGVATSLNLAPWEFRRNFAEGVRCGNDFDLLGGKPTGIVRISFGAMSSLQDVRSFQNFVRDNFVDTTASLAPVPGVPNVSLSETQLRIERLMITPVIGCPSWEISSATAWEVRDGALALDRDWCVVHLTTEEILTPEECPTLRLLHPSLHFQEGVLRIRYSKGEEEKDLSVSLWDSPSGGKQQILADLDYQKPETYRAADVAQFFTDILGVPCTLARFPDVRASLGSKDSSHGQAALALCYMPSAIDPNGPSYKQSTNKHTGLASSLQAYTLVFAANASDQVPCNITLSRGLACTPTNEEWQYIRLGKQYFQVLESKSQKPLGEAFVPSASPIKYLRHIQNTSDRSPAAQYPTVAIGDCVQTYTRLNVDEDADLRACIASTFAADFVCPASSCRGALMTLEALQAHRRMHDQTVPSEEQPPPLSPNDSDCDSHVTDPTLASPGLAPVQHPPHMLATPVKSKRNRLKAFFSTSMGFASPSFS